MTAHPNKWLAYQGTCQGHHHPEANAVRVEDLAARYTTSGPAALTGIRLLVPRGERLALIGDNGSGKSTLLKCLAGLLTPFDGSTVVLGHPPGVCRHEVAYLPQHSSLDWDFPISVQQFVLTGSYVRLGWLRRAGKQQRESAAAVLHQLGLSDLAHKQIGSLSGGQQQRTLVARTLLHRAELVLLDEPFNAVDDTSRDLIWAALDDLRTKGCTVIMATHEIAHVRERFDRVITLENGHLTDD